MQIIKFTMNEKYYDEFKDMCIKQDITVKKKLNILLSQDTEPGDITKYFPSDYDESIRSVTLKVNEELYKGVMKNCGRFDLKSRKYVPYLIYKYLLSAKNEGQPVT
jgi:hypothetical protein